MHGDKSQGQRERALARFEAGDVDALVATDVAARGIDVDGITHVINFDAPGDRDSYVHRVGRTGRAGRTRHRDQLRPRRPGRRGAPHGRRPRPRPGVRADMATMPRPARTGTATAAPRPVARGPAARRKAKAVAHDRPTAAQVDLRPLRGLGQPARRRSRRRCRDLGDRRRRHFCLICRRERAARRRSTRRPPMQHRRRASSCAARGLIEFEVRRAPDEPTNADRQGLPHLGLRRSRAARRRRRSAARGRRGPPRSSSASRSPSSRR